MGKLRSSVEVVQTAAVCTSSSSIPTCGAEETAWFLRKSIHILVFFSSPIDNVNFPHSTPVHSAPPACMFPSWIGGLQECFYGTVVSKHCYSLLIEEVSKMRDGPHYSQDLEFCDPIVSL